MPHSRAMNLMAVGEMERLTEGTGIDETIQRNDSVVNQPCQAFIGFNRNRSKTGSEINHCMHSMTHKNWHYHWRSRFSHSFLRNLLHCFKSLCHSLSPISHSHSVFNLASCSFADRVFPTLIALFRRGNHGLVFTLFTPINLHRDELHENLLSPPRTELIAWRLAQNKRSPAINDRARKTDNNQKRQTDLHA
jgi:hypothetical protein